MSILFICGGEKNGNTSALGRALLPWHGQREDGATIGGESSLLPYHSNVQPAQATSALNRLIDDANAGETVAYPVYDEAAIAADPDKADAALFYFRGEPGAPFAIVNPGGGFAYVGSLHESLPMPSDSPSRASAACSVLV